MKSIEVTDKNLDKVLSKEGITVLDFWAPWCGPCRMVGPVIDELAEENKDIQIGKVNIDSEQLSAVKFGIRSIPCIIFFKDGKQVDKLMGAQPKGAFQEKINFLNK